MSWILKSNKEIKADAGMCYSYVTSNLLVYET